MKINELLNEGLFDQKARISLSSDKITSRLRDIETTTPLKIDSYDIRARLTAKLDRNNPEHQQKHEDIRNALYAEIDIQEALTKEKEEELEKLYAAFFSLVSTKMTLFSEELAQRWNNFENKYTSK